MKRNNWPVSKELRAAIKATEVPADKFVKPSWQKRLEAVAVRNELKNDATMTKAQRSRQEHKRQIGLAVQRVRVATQKRIGDILTGLQDKERVTNMGLVLPNARQIGEILSGASDRK